MAAAGNITKASDWPYYSGLLVSSVNTVVLCGMAVYFVLTRGDLQRRE